MQLIVKPDCGSTPAHVDQMGAACRVARSDGAPQGGRRAAAPAARVGEQMAAGGPAISERQDFKIRLANTGAGRASASMLINKMYGWRGYGDAHRVQEGPNVVTLTASASDALIGTVTLGIDSPDRGLLADEIFRPEIDAARRAGGKPCELTKFALDPEGSSKQALGSLFHVLFIYARRIHGCTDAFIEVNPRHRRFYEAMLGFSRVGPERENPRVKAPASLLWVSLDEMERKIAAEGGASEGHRRARSLYPFFFSKAEEDGICGRLLALE